MNYSNIYENIWQSSRMNVGEKLQSIFNNCTNPVQVVVNEVTGRYSRGMFKIFENIVNLDKVLKLQCL